MSMGAPSRGPSGVLSDPRVRAWDKLLRDPCSAELTYPCYSGLDTGYLVRTVDYYQPGINGTFTVGQAGRVNFVGQWAPSNTSNTSGWNIAAVATGGTLPNFTALGFSNFIGSNTVKKYRPVASCIKWTPNGPYSTRAGVVSMAVIPGVEFVAGTTRPFSDIRASCQHYASNGAEAHEVRWLPTATDEHFTDILASNNSSAGTALIVLDSVDAVAVSTTLMACNGYIEVVTAWEWIPEALNGLAVSPKAPLPYTTQQVLATISDMGRFVFEGVRAVSSTPGLVSAAANVAATVLSGGMRSSGGPGRSMPMVMQY